MDKKDNKNEKVKFINEIITNLYFEIVVNVEWEVAFTLMNQ